jgi:hypothetical protein
VFVHGFNGHPERTWTHKRGNARHCNSDEHSHESVEPLSKARRLNPLLGSRRGRDDPYTAVYWSRDLLSETVPNARVLTYGYDTQIRHWVNSLVSKNTVYDIAWDFLVALEAVRRSESSRPILFIVHSLGGIVVKEMLRRSSVCHLHHTHLRDVFDSTIGIMFFGISHGGADPRGLLQHIAEKVMKAAGFCVNKHIVDTLLSSSERLRELKDEFAPMADWKKWTIHSFQEELGVQALNGQKVCNAGYYMRSPAHCNLAGCRGRIVISELSNYRDYRAHSAVGKMVTSRYFGDEIFWKDLGEGAPSLGLH